MKLKEIFERLTSRKFIVWVVATVAMFLNLIEGWIWAAITGAYIGINFLDWKDQRLVKFSETPPKDS